jgi:hypothetical protein
MSIEKRRWKEEITEFLARLPIFRGAGRKQKYESPEVVYESVLEVRAGTPAARPEDLPGNNPPDGRYDR